MKKIFYFLFLIPCLCFGQLGINVKEPNATLHVVKHENSKPALKIENIDQQKTDQEETQSYNNLIIFEDGTIQKYSPDINLKNRFYFKETTSTLGYSKKLANSYPEVKDPPVINFTNPAATDPKGQIKVIEERALLFTFNFIGEIVNRKENEFSNIQFGEIELQVVRNGSNESKDKLLVIRMHLLANTESNDINFSASGIVEAKKDDVLSVRFYLLNYSNNNAPAWGVKFKHADEDGQKDASSFIISRL